MKKVLLSVLMALMFAPMGMSADSYKSKYIAPHDQFPAKAPALYYVNAWIDSETGEFSICANYNIPCLYVSIVQNGIMLDTFSCPVINSVPVLYDFSGYATGSYIVTLSNAEGVISQYCVTVEHD